MCRAFLSPWYERGGMYPADEFDTPIFVGRFNIGAVSLNLPMILARARDESRDFYEVLDYYLEMIRGLHLRTYGYLGEMKASTNPLAYCEGGFLGGRLKASDKIAPILDSATASFGITAFNELQQLYNGKSLVEDGQFAIDVLKHINNKIDEYKRKDGRLYAIYGTPAENLCFAKGTMVQTIDGSKPIEKIKSGELVYSYNEDKKKIELKPVISSGLSKELSNVVKVTFDNRQAIICTPNHPFAVRKMQQDEKGRIVKEYIEYVEAKDLKNGFRIKSNYLHINPHGRLECSIYHDGKKQLVQDVVAEYFYGEKPDGYVTHHKDEDKLNNTPTNLEYVTGKEHRLIHLSKTIEKYQYKSEDTIGANNPFYGKSHSESSRNKNREAHIKHAVVRTDLDGRVIDTYDCIADANRQGFAHNSVLNSCKGENNLYKFPEYNGHYYKDSLWYFNDELEAMQANHQVVSVEFITDQIPVYNLNVLDNHNYFVGGDDGILVHNCGLQVRQFRDKYGIIKGVSDKDYVSNSFHCHVSEDITPTEKQDLEGRFWELSNGGKIQYVKYPLDYNVNAVKTLIRRAMKMGFYEGVNMSLAYCDDCGHQELEMDSCPVCGSRNLTKIDRMNGYLAFSRVHGDSRLSDHKMSEIADRKSM